MANLRRNDHAHFRTTEGSRGLLETIFKEILFKPLVFGSFGEMSSNVREMIEITVKYGAEHLGTTHGGNRRWLRRETWVSLMVFSWLK